MSNKYHFNPHPWGTHQIILSLLTQNQQILDVGCVSGYLGQHDKGKNIFWGVEIDPIQARKARKNGYQKVIAKDIRAIKPENFSGKKFDVIILADILEHLFDPQETLTFLTKKFLKDEGKIIISLPNIAHFTIRLGLLIGRFSPQKSGILDKTHLHFYTLETAQNLIEDSGLKIEKLLFSSNRFGKFINRWSFWGPLLGFNLIFLCTKK